MGLACADFDDDGDLDIYSTNIRSGASIAAWDNRDAWREYVEANAGRLPAPVAFERPEAPIYWRGRDMLTAIWFGILVLIVVEVGLITPPVGMNLFIINAMDRDTPMSATYKAVLWFVTSDLIRVVILVAFPAITLFLLM